MNHEQPETILTWSEVVAALAADILLDRQLIKKEDIGEATAVIAEEIHVRLCLNDYPPQSNTQ